MKALLEALQTQGPSLADKAIEEMYRDPFWLLRFGERGRKYSLEDSRHHLKYLLEALTAGQPVVLSAYGRWLQGVLVTRGMCSLHLEENFARLARLIEEAKLPDARVAVAYLRDAQQALRYSSGPAQAVLQLSIQNRQAQFLQAYLADSVAQRDPQIFLKHVQWMRSTNQPVDSLLREIPREKLPSEALEAFDGSR